MAEPICCVACGGNNALAGFDRCEDCLVAAGAIPDPKDLVCSYCGEAEPCNRPACISAGRYDLECP